MITEKEIQAARLSPTKKDFYQIWNELLDTAGKISERWDPSSTNESDPGIVLLKVLTAVADKLNYNIDKNILEAFMPSVTQAENMRKLCEMMGYNIKYYQSATTEATISYTGENREVGAIIIPAFSTLTDVDNKIIYTTTQTKTLYVKSSDTTTQQISSTKVNCIEGSIQYCKTNNDNIITINLLDDNKRFYMPEAQIAENGIFVTNYDATGGNTDFWEPVENLNTVEAGKKVYKFGYDSKVAMPYLQFPDDISSLIENGLIIRYIRTSGINGNISVGTLASIESAEFGNDNVSAADFNVTNTDSAQNGTGIETINQAYNNYKKTIGTFDTLVTCRDYMNKIYQLVDETTSIPLVSNDIVADIRDDINRAFVLCEFNENGIIYVDKAVPVTNETAGAIDNFDLILYPFRTVYGINDESEYVDSFKYTDINKNLIESMLEKNKTISHTFNYPQKGEITCIKNYLKLNARITTTYKVNTTEEKSILNNIYKAIYTNFNSRNIDFGEEIPFETILAAVENADERIKNVALEEPELYTAIQAINSENKLVEYSVASSGDDATTYNKLMNKLTLRNILAGKLKMFKYDDRFKQDYDSETYSDESASGSGTVEYKSIYPETTNQHITELRPSCTIDTTKLPVTLTEGEVISFRAPNFRTTITYPAYVNYNLHLGTITESGAVPATFYTFSEYLYSRDTIEVEDSGNVGMMSTTPSKIGSPAYIKGLGNIYTRKSTGTYYVNLNENTFVAWYNWITEQDSNETDESGQPLDPPRKLTGFYRIASGVDASRLIGELVDVQHRKYGTCVQWSTVKSMTQPFDSLYVQHTWTDNLTDLNTPIANRHCKNGFGIDNNLSGIPANSEYRLGANDSLEIQYTKSSTDGSADTQVSVNYGVGTIIRPNFELQDSETWHKNGKSWDKTTPNNFMTLSTNEQIEIRELAKIAFYDDTYKNTVANVYWELTDNADTFPFDSNGRYILKDNEYFYYTNQDKLELAYYGSGSEVIRIGNFDLVRDSNATKVFSKDILLKGIQVIPWVQINNLSSTKNIEIQEYQYLNLTEGDTLKTITFDTGYSSPIKTGEYKPCSKVEYTLSTGETNSLPVIITSDSSQQTSSWKVTSKLMVNVGPYTTQNLQSAGRDKIEVWGYTAPDVRTNINKITDLVPGKNKTLSLRANYALASSLEKIDTTVTVYETDGETVKEYKDDFSLSVFNKVDVPISTSSSITFNNFGDYTKINSTEIPDTGITLSTKLGSSEFGLIMMYYVAPEGKDVAKYASIITENATAGTAKSPKIYNYEGDASGWWKDRIVSNKYYLRPGMNVIKLEQAAVGETTSVAKIKIYPQSTEVTDGTLIISDLSLITGFNNEILDYKATDDGLTPLTQMLKDIRALDTDNNFFYNNPIDNSTALDINENLNEKITDPIIFYDYNNLNNKFVISEISATDMKQGITIARTSKL